MSVVACTFVPLYPPGEGARPQSALAVGLETWKWMRGFSHLDPRRRRRRSSSSAATHRLIERELALA